MLRTSFSNSRKRESCARPDAIQIKRCSLTPEHVDRQSFDAGIKESGAGNPVPPDFS
jgi:hypothetical protein